MTVQKRKVPAKRRTKKPAEPAAPQVQTQVPVKRIALFGTTPSRLEGPHQDDSGWERWTIGPGAKDIHNWERLFEVHGVWPEGFKDYLNDLSKVEKPRLVYTIPQPGTPSATWESAIASWKREHGLDDSVIEGDWSARVDYPREQILQMFPRRMWFSSSISWCMALALAEMEPLRRQGVTCQLGLWGIDLESGEEYVSQFPGCAFFIDAARMMGIEVHVPENCGLVRDPAPYPDRYETNLALFLEKKNKYLTQSLDGLRPQYEQIQAQVHQQQGRLAAMREILEKGAIPKQEEIVEAERVLYHNGVYADQAKANMHKLEGELSAIKFTQTQFVFGIDDPG